MKLRLILSEPRAQPEPAQTSLNLHHQHADLNHHKPALKSLYPAFSPHKHVHCCCALTHKTNYTSSLMTHSITSAGNQLRNNIIFLPTLNERRLSSLCGNKSAPLPPGSEFIHFTVHFLTPTPPEINLQQS